MEQGRVSWKSLCHCCWHLWRKKESGHHRQCWFYNLLSSVKVNSSKICQFYWFCAICWIKYIVPNFIAIVPNFIQIVPFFIDVFYGFYRTAIVPTFIDIVPFLINIVPTNNLFLTQILEKRKFFTLRPPPRKRREISGWVRWVKWCSHIGQEMHCWQTVAAGPFWLCFACPKLGDAGKTRVASKNRAV